MRNINSLTKNINNLMRNINSLTKNINSLTRNINNLMTHLKINNLIQIFEKCKLINDLINILKEKMIYSLMKK